MSLGKAFPPGLADDVHAVATIMLKERQPPRHWFTVCVGDKPVTIPARLYVDEPGWLSRRRLTDRQRAVLTCLYARHHDGIVRQPPPTGHRRRRAVGGAVRGAAGR